MINELFWKKYRPSDLDQIILLPRIRKLVENGINTNLLFYGPFGCGKTSLSKILMEGNPYFKLNASLDTSIEILRTKIYEFCSTMSMFDGKDDIKIVLLDEIDRISPLFQEALKGFIEEYEQNVRFIATTNHISKVNDGIKSRVISIDFAAINKEEEIYLKNEYAKKLVYICKNEDISLDNDNIKKIVSRNYPDLRQMVTVLQHIKATGEKEFESVTFNPRIQELLFKQILDNNDTISDYNFMMVEFGPEKVSDMIQIMGRPFIEYCARNKRELLPKLGEILEIVTEYSYKLQTSSIDPIVTSLGLISAIRKKIIKL